MRTKEILVVEDDLHIGEMVEEVLRKNGYGVRRAFSGSEAILAARASRPDLILLDLMLPGRSGEDVLPELGGIPVIVVSAKADVTDKVELLSAGAVDYITKPFDTAELLARIAVHLRPAAGSGGLGLSVGGAVLDAPRLSLSAGGKQVHLTRTEAAILKLLAANPGQVLPKSHILDLICADTPDCTESSLKVHISNLRRKLSEVGAGADIEAVWGIGFLLREAPQDGAG